MALRWFKQGVITFPLYYATKKPTVSWGQWAHIRPEWREIATAFDTKLYRNLAVMTGTQSGNLVVLDFDMPLPYYVWADTHTTLSETYTVKTSRGHHVYFYMNEMPSRTGQMEGGDIKVTGYVAAPPSMHKSGVPYQVVKPGAPIYKVNDLAETGVTMLENDIPLPETGSPSGNPKGVIQRIKNRLPLVDYLARFTQVVPSSTDGRWMTCCCLFHSDSTPSMWIDTVAQRCGCFRTDCVAHRLHQDVINVHAHVTGMDNRQAISDLVRMLGL